MDLREAEDWFRARPDHPLLTALFLTKEQLGALSELARRAVQNVRLEQASERLERQRMRVKPSLMHKTWPSFSASGKSPPRFRTKRPRA